MDAVEFQRVYAAFEEFHSLFAPAFGRKQRREHGRHYLQALLVQSQERRNAGNLSESVGVSARALQRFLTDSGRDDDEVIGRLQEYLGPRLGHRESVWVLDGSDFPKQGMRSAGVARQYCGRLGKVANCQAGMFLTCVSPLGRVLTDNRLYLPESSTSYSGRCEAAGVPEDRRGYRSRTELALEMLGRALERGHLRSGWVAGGDVFHLVGPDGLRRLSYRQAGFRSFNFRSCHKGSSPSSTSGTAPLIPTPTSRSLRNAHAPALHLRPPRQSNIFEPVARRVNALTESCIVQAIPVVDAGLDHSSSSKQDDLIWIVPGAEPANGYRKNARTYARQVSVRRATHSQRHIPSDAPPA